MWEELKNELKDALGRQACLPSTMLLFCEEWEETRTKNATLGGASVDDGGQRSCQSDTLGSAGITVVASIAQTSDQAERLSGEWTSLWPTKQWPFARQQCRGALPKKFCVSCPEAFQKILESPPSPSTTFISGFFCSCGSAHKTRPGGRIVGGGIQAVQTEVLCRNENTAGLMRLSSVPAEQRLSATVTVVYEHTRTSLIILSPLPECWAQSPCPGCFPWAISLTRPWHGSRAQSPTESMYSVPSIAAKPPKSNASVCTVFGLTPHQVPCVCFLMPSLCLNNSVCVILRERARVWRVCCPFILNRSRWHSPGVTAGA